MSATPPPHAAGDRTMLPAFIGAGLAVSALASSALGPRVFLVVTAAALALGALELRRMIARAHGRGVPPLLVALAAAAFPVAASRWGEGGVLPATGAVLVAVAAALVLPGLRPRATLSAAIVLFAALSVGFLGSYLVLIRDDARGGLLVVAFVAMIAFYRAGRWSGRAGPLAALLARFPAGLRIWPEALGLVASVAGAAGSLAALRLPYRTGPFLGLGVIVGAAAALGSFSGALMRSDLQVSARAGSVPGFGGVLLQLESVLPAAPAFFYAFRLYLT